MQDKGQGPNTDPGFINVNYWKPHSIYDKTNIIQGITLYMDIDFDIEHTINQNGKIEISFSNCNVSTTS